VGGPIASVRLLADRIEQVLARDVTLVSASSRPVRQIAWCTGGAQSYFDAAIAAGY